MTDVTKIRSHQNADPQVCQKILGYDASALYLSMMLHNMPCGPEKVSHFEGWTDDATV